MIHYYDARHLHIMLASSQGRTYRSAQQKGLASQVHQGSGKVISLPCHLLLPYIATILLLVHK